MEEDTSGYQWVSSNASSLQVRPSILIAFAKGPSMKVSIVRNSFPIDGKKTLWYVKAL